MHSATKIPQFFDTSVIRGMQMKFIHELLLGVLCFFMISQPIYGQPPNIIRLKNGSKNNEKGKKNIISNAPSRSQIEFSEDGIAVMRFLAKGGFEGKSFRQNRNSSFLIGMVTIIGVVASAPTVTGPFIFLILGGTGTLLSSANTIDELVLSRPHYNLGRLIKASYVYLGWDTPNEQKLLKHHSRIRKYIFKYLDDSADEALLESVARSIVFANEKGWFGFMVPIKKPNQKFKKRSAYVAGSITKRGKLHEILFPNRQLSSLIHQDSSISEKIASFHQFQGI